MRRCIIFFFAVALFCAISYIYIDQPLALFLKENYVKEFFENITVLGLSKWYLWPTAASSFFFYFLYKKPILAYRAVFIFSSVALSGIVVNLIKPLAARARPVMLFEHQQYGFEFFRLGYEFSSFPSGHSATVFSLFAAVSLLYRLAFYPMLIFALMIAASRVIIGAHYLGDAVFGAFVGVCMTVTIWKFFAEKSEL